MYLVFIKRLHILHKVEKVSLQTMSVSLCFFPGLNDQEENCWGEGGEGMEGSLSSRASLREDQTCLHPTSRIRGCPCCPTIEHREYNDFQIAAFLFKHRIVLFLKGSFLKEWSLYLTMPLLENSGRKNGERCPFLPANDLVHSVLEEPPASQADPGSGVCHSWIKE